MNDKKYQKSTFIDKQVDFFRKCYVENPSLLGMEYEHELIHTDTLKSYNYDEINGQKQMMERLTHHGWEILLEEEGCILGLVKDGSTITLEPGGQVEISLKPFNSVESIKTGYEQVVTEIYAVLDSKQALASIGYHPKSKINELTLLPKERYRLMYDYFKQAGDYCHNMMKGTCATQVSIDFKDEADFIKKFRVANYLSPVFASLFDSTPIFEGALTNGANMRAKIWAKTDIERSKLIPQSLSKIFGFADYASYLLSLPPILLYSNGKFIYSQKERLEEVLNEYTFTDEALEHHLSMVFPDVRLKKFIEIRMPDALPYPYNLSVSVVINGIFYDSNLLEKYYQKSLRIDDVWVSDQNNHLINDIYSIELETLKNEVLSDVMSTASAENASILMQFKMILDQWGSMTLYLKHLYETDLNQFTQAIIVHPKSFSKRKQEDV